MKKSISFLIILLSLAALMPSSVAAVEYNGSGSYYTTLTNVELTGNYHTDMVAVAKSQVGYHESNSSSDLGGGSSGSYNYTEYGRYNQDNGAPWCAYFVSWCARVAGVPIDVITSTGKAACDYFGVTWHDNDYTPKKGNLIFFDYDGYFDKPYSAHADHVGIVTDVDSSYVYTIEGNSNNAVTEHKYSLTYSCIKGYGSYEDSTSVEAGAEETDVIRTLKDNLPFKASLAENCKINAYSDCDINKVGRVYESDIFVVKAIEHKNYTWWAKSTARGLRTGAPSQRQFILS